MSISRPAQHSFTWALLGLLVLLLSTAATAGKLYKWQDADGNWHYTDRMPPEQSQGEHARLNERGIEVERRERPKTAEEIAREQELARLRDEQARILAEQQARDRVLLRSFRSEDDIILTRDGKIATIDSKISLTHDSILRLKGRLAEMQGNAARLEREGKAVNAKFRQGIEETRGAIEEAYASIVRQEEFKRQIREQYERDLVRFRVLKSLRADDSVDDVVEELISIDLVETVFSCEARSDCDLAWKKAQQYAKRHATTKIQVIGDRIFMTRAPRENDDLSVTVSRILDDDNNEKIFLDVQCRKTALAREYCASDQVAAIKQGFRDAIRP